MNRNLLIFFIGIVIYSCELTYEDNSRVLVEGQISSFGNEALPKLPIDVYASGNFPAFIATREQIDLIGASMLKLDGKYQIIAISAQNNDYISLVYNDEGKEGFDVSWSTIIINGIKRSSSENFKYEIPDVIIGRKVNSNLQINRISNTQDTLIYWFEYNSTVKEINLNPDVPQSTYWEKQDYGELTPSDLTKDILLKVIQGDSIAFHYELRNNGVVQRKDVKLQFNENGYKFEF